MDKERFGRLFDRISKGRRRQDTWSDFITVTACAIANAAIMEEKREEIYKSVMRKYAPEERERLFETACEYFKLVEENPYQDLLGDLYMRLGLNNDKAGQFFTPYNVCRLMAEMQADDAMKEIERRGWIGINDCACGGGATMIAMAEALKNRGCNYQERAFFVGQDLIETTAMMCYIQMSMLGCAGFVKCGDTLKDPLSGNGPFAPNGENIWITPMYHSKTWAERRMAHKMDEILLRRKKNETKEKDKEKNREKPEAKKEKKDVGKRIEQMAFF